MMKNINPFSVAWSKLSAISQSKLNKGFEELENDRSEEYLTDTNSQQYLDPYLIDRVEPSLEHIIFSSYIRF
jgi:hypothetical protein